jgi:hypothetical protein
MTNEIEPFKGEPSEPRHPVPPAPIHPLAALATIVLDNVFGWIEIIDPFALLVTSLTVGGVSFLTTLFVQRYLARDEWGASVAKGLVMGVLAGVPFQVTGTAVGALLLGWAGANKWVKLPSHDDGDRLSDSEIVDVDPKQ